MIPLTARLQPLLEGHFALHDTLGISETLQRVVRAIANRANISREVSPHVLRHTFSVTAVQKDISLTALQRLLGHDHLATTEIYLNLSPEYVIKEFGEKGCVLRESPRIVTKKTKAVVWQPLPPAALGCALVQRRASKQVEGRRGTERCTRNRLK